MMDTVTERKTLFQALVLHYERKYGVTTKQAIKELTKEIKQACYVS